MDYRDWKQSKNTKITKMDQKKLNSTFVATRNKIDVVKDLLSDSWIKESGSSFYKTRNKYIIKLSGNHHPIWQVSVSSKAKILDENDWKLRKDFKSIKNLGKKLDKRLYLNEDNRKEIIQLINALIVNGFSLVYNENYIIFINGDTMNIFKIAATMNLHAKEDGWYVGQKKIF
jgi:predicted oxidoreductase (fatty acid repression mutant protein)